MFKGSSIWVYFGSRKSFYFIFCPVSFYPFTFSYLNNEWFVLFGRVGGVGFWKQVQKAKKKEAKNDVWKGVVLCKNPLRFEHIIQVDMISENSTEVQFCVSIWGHSLMSVLLAFHISKEASWITVTWGIQTHHQLCQKVTVQPSTNACWHLGYYVLTYCALS